MHKPASPLRRPYRLSAMLLVAAAIHAACATDTPVTPPEPVPPVAPPVRDLTWLQANAIPFRTAAPDGDDADLMVLKDMIGNARIVALGEGTHGTREFFQMKHRLLEFLVREMGFDIFAIEATWAESNHVNEFVRTGVGNPAALLSRLHFWTWNTQEVLDMILWMRRHNQVAGANGVSFAGFDMQFSVQAMDDVVTYVWSVDETSVATVGQKYVCWRTWERAQTYRNAPAATRAECRDGVQVVYDLLAKNEAKYVQLSSAEAYAHALQAARIVVQHEYLRSEIWRTLEINARDRFMAENVEWLLEQGGPDAKIVLWAHNAHVMDVDGWMGSHLRRRFGNDMVIVGFSFHQGTFNAFPRNEGNITGPLSAQASASPLPGSYEYYLNQVEPARFMADLRPLRQAAPTHAAWLLGPLPLRMVGAVYDTGREENNYLQIRLPHDFDVLIHFRATEASRLLPFVTQ
jgi:erythromycin esterase